MLQTAPTSTFVLIQTQVSFPPLEILFAGPPPPTQTQGAALVGFLSPMGDVNVIGFQVPFGPIHDQPATRSISAQLRRCKTINFTTKPV